jgi:hypothetical protein
MDAERRRWLLARIARAEALLARGDKQHARRPPSHPLLTCDAQHACNDYDPPW